jgi:predicted nucleic acid-binding protein
MSIASLEQAISEGDRVLIDTTGLIAYLSGGEAATPLATHVFDVMVRSGRNPCLISTVTVMESLVHPLRAGVAQPYDHLLDFVTRFPNVRVLPVDLAVAQEAAHCRAAYRLSTPDALIVGTALVGQVRHIVTNDSDWERKLQALRLRISVCYLRRHL